MGIINYVLKILAVVFIFIVVTKIFMVIANYIGEQLGFGKVFENLWKRISKK